MDDIFANDSERVMEDTFVNHSLRKCPFEQDHSTLQLRFYSVPIICTVIAIINFSVVISSGLILKRGQGLKGTYLFLGNIAMADFVTACLLIFGQIYLNYYQDHYFCLIIIGMIMSAVLSSVYSVGLIAIDRFFYIVHGIKYKQYLYPSRARMLIGATWIIGIIVGCLPLFGWGNDTENGKCCWFAHIAHRNHILLTAMMTFIPFGIVFVLYSIILYNALEKIGQIKKSTSDMISGNTDNDNVNHPRQFRGNIQSDSNYSAQDKFKGFLNSYKSKPSITTNVPNKWKAIKVVLFTAGIFLITWVPTFTVHIIYALKCKHTSEQCEKIVMLYVGPFPILVCINYLINPIIYIWWHKGFRQFIKDRLRSFNTLITMWRTRSSLQE